MNQRLQGGRARPPSCPDVLNKDALYDHHQLLEGRRRPRLLPCRSGAYSGENARNGFQGALNDEALHAISRLAEAPLRVETRTKKVAVENGEVMEQSVRFRSGSSRAARGRR